MFKKALVEAAAGLLLLVCVFMISRYVGLAAAAQSVHIGRDKPVVVLDAGHPAVSLGTENETRPCV